MGGSRGVEGDLYAAVFTTERTCESQTDEPFRAKLQDRTDMALLLPVRTGRSGASASQQISPRPPESID
jgi:hypothetical protein